MNLSVIGCGYLGALHAACVAKLGHTVVGFDVDVAKIGALPSGKAPFLEPGLGDLLAETLATGRSRFTADPGSLANCEVHFLCGGNRRNTARMAPT